jgi:hypothetical protein
MAYRTTQVAPPQLAPVPKSGASRTNSSTATASSSAPTVPPLGSSAATVPGVGAAADSLAVKIEPGLPIDGAEGAGTTPVKKAGFL